jgi:hypothetical protein
MLLEELAPLLTAAGRLSGMAVRVDCGANDSATLGGSVEADGAAGATRPGAVGHHRGYRSGRR